MPRLYSDAANAELLSAWLPRNPVRRVLKTDLFDEACTDGLVAQVAERAELTFGIDVSADIVGVARDRHGGLRCVRADVRNLPFKAGAFDFVLSNSTLDHFSSRGDIERSLRELGRVLKPGGLMIVSLDNLANPIIALRSALPLPLLRRLRIVPYFVGATLGPRGLRRALTEAGFDVRDLTAIVHFPRVLLVAIDRLAGRRLGVNGTRRLLLAARWFEKMGRLPTRFVSGHFVAARALKK